jgi:hypothetical protein
LHPNNVLGEDLGKAKVLENTKAKKTKKKTTKVGE